MLLRQLRRVRGGVCVCACIGLRVPALAELCDVALPVCLLGVAHARLLLLRQLCACVRWGAAEAAGARGGLHVCGLVDGWGCDASTRGRMQRKPAHHSRAAAALHAPCMLLPPLPRAPHACPAVHTQVEVTVYTDGDRAEDGTTSVVRTCIGRVRGVTHIHTHTERQCTSEGASSCGSRARAVPTNACSSSLISQRCLHGHCCRRIVTRFHPTAWLPWCVTCPMTTSGVARVVEACSDDGPPRDFTVVCSPSRPDLPVVCRRSTCVTMAA
jgi:hypothetical protein